MPNQIVDSLAQSFSSVFTNHQLKVVYGTPVLREYQAHYWQAIVLFLALVLFVTIKVLNPKKVNQVFLSIVNLQMAKQLFREDYKLNKRVSLFLSLFFIIIFAFFIQLFNNHYNLILQKTEGVLQYGFFITLLLVMYSIKFSINSILAFITKASDIDKEYRFTVMIFNQVAAVVLFPLVVALQFSSLSNTYFLHISLAVIFAFLLLRFYRGLVISSLEQNLGVLYIFLYLCALEILPILVLIKFLLINF